MSFYETYSLIGTFHRFRANEKEIEIFTMHADPFFADKSKKCHRNWLLVTRRPRPPESSSQFQLL
jgi:hypothetical protein